MQKYILLSVLAIIAILVIGVWTSIAVLIGASVGFILGEPHGIGWAIFGIFLGGLTGIVVKQSLTRQF